MNTKNLEKYLQSFGKQVVKESRTKLSKAKKNVTNDLYNSIRFEVVKNGKGFSVQFFMDSYGKFVDKGVSGNKKGQSYTDYEGKNVPSPFAYTTKGPPIDILSKWIKMRGIKPKGLGRGRSKDTGQFVSGFAFLISRKIKRDGIKSLSFFQRSLQLGLKDFFPQVAEAIKKDIADALKLKKKK